MHVKTTSGSGAAGLGIIGTGLALALPDAKWIGWLLVVAGLFVFIFDIRLERGHIAVGSSKSVRERLKRMWPQYLMVFSGCLFFVGLVGFLQLNVSPPEKPVTEDTKPSPEVPIAAKTVLISANRPMPPTRCRIPTGAMAIFFGSSVAWSDTFPFTAIKMGGEDALVLDKEPSTGALRIKHLRLYDDKGAVIAQIDDGAASEGTNKQQPDASRIIIYDHYDREILFLSYLNPNAMVLRGVFRHPTVEPRFLIISETEFIVMPNRNSTSEACMGRASLEMNSQEFGIRPQ